MVDSGQARRVPQFTGVSEAPEQPIPRLSARQLSKSFGSVSVLEDVSLDFFPGEIHAVVGENGAGKSTLMKILAGVLEPSGGEVWFDGCRTATGDVRAMEGLGVRFIHQELNLAEQLNVKENLFLGEEPGWGPFLDEREMLRRGRDALAKIGAAISLDTRISDLRVSEKQMVEIAKATSRRASAIILDEPTAVLTKSEALRLLQLVKVFAKEGVAIVYISHRLEEVKQVADRITVLRDGRLITTRSANDLSANEIVRLMVGRNLHDLFPKKTIRPTKPASLEVRDLTVPGYATDCSFSLREGEILGFAGLIGAGRTELFEGILGLRPKKSGQVYRQGRLVKVTDYSCAIRQLRAVYLPEDRKSKGLILSFDPCSNFSLLGLRRFGAWFVNRRQESRAFEKATQQFEIKSQGFSMPTYRLSGGNQQKVVLAKISTVEPEILILDEPTRGIDIGTKAQIYRWIAELADRGHACVVISSELLELIGLCHRVIVMRSSRIVASLENELINEDEIMLYATGIKSANPLVKV